MRNNTCAALLTLAALFHYPFAMFLPILRVEELGLQREVNIVDGVLTLFASGKPLIALVILCFSIVLPIGKIAAIFFLATKGLTTHSKHRLQLLRACEFAGRWGMLDVMLVAVLLAILKMDMVQMSPGPGLVAFTLCVLLSLLSAACFDPESIWEQELIVEELQ